MEKNAKLAPLQASLRQVAIFLHNADFYRLRRSKMPANALRQIYFPARPPTNPKLQQRKPTQL